MIDLWVIQTGLGKQADIAGVVSALQEIGCDYHLVSYPDMPIGYPIGKRVLFYGSSNFVDYCERLVPHFPALVTQGQFEYSTYIRKYGRLVLNWDAEIEPMSHTVLRGYREEKEYFFRPNKDSKSFAGMVTTFKEYRDWVNTLIVNPSEIDTNSNVVIAPVRTLETEWRCFIVAGKVISGSQYRTFGVLDLDENVPEYVVDFCENASRVWGPARVFVMDIAYHNGKLHIIELNGFNSSGFYAADIGKIVKAIGNLK